MDRYEARTTLVRNAEYFIKWSIISSVIGAVVGLVGTVFAKAVIFVTSFWMAHNWTIYLMPVSGVLIIWLYRTFHEEKNRGTNMVIDSISSNNDISFATGPLIFISTVLTHVVGGSSGREGAALQLGGSLGNVFGKVLKLDERDRKITIMCGMSACFAALFGTPLAAGVFSMEVVNIGIMYYAALIPCLFASFTGAFVARHFGVLPEAFPVTEVPPFTYQTALFIIVLGILCACVSTLFCVAMHTSEHIYHEKFKNPYIRILVASVIFIALTLIVGNRDYNGGGFPLIERCMEGDVRYEAFLMKILFTAVALGAGFRGGEIVPTLCIGATFGCAVGTIAGFSPTLCTACGMVALFVGVTNCPITSLLIAFELFGYEAMPYYAIIIAVSFTLSGYYGLYSSQKFAYSKIRTEFINRKAH